MGAPVKAGKRKWFFSLVAVVTLLAVAVIAGLYRQLQATIREGRSPSNAPEFVFGPQQWITIGELQGNYTKGTISKVSPTSPLFTTNMPHATFWCEIYNTGGPSVTHNWSAAAVFHNGPTNHGFIANQMNASSIRFKSGESMTIDPLDDIRKKTRTNAIATGTMVEGFVTFVFPGVDIYKLQESSTVFTLRVRDVRNREYSLVYTNSGEVLR